MLGYILLVLNCIMLWINVSRDSTGLAVASTVGVLFSLFIIYMDTNRRA